MYLLILPNQLFKDHVGLSDELDKVIFLESPYYFDRHSKSHGSDESIALNL